MDVKKVGNKVTITIELQASEEHTSAKGNKVLYTSHGFQYIDGLGFAVNIIQSKREG